MAIIGTPKKVEDRSVLIYKYTDVQSGNVEHSFWCDKYEEEIFYGYKTIQEIVVEDFCAEDHI